MRQGPRLISFLLLTLPLGCQTFRPKEDPNLIPSTRLSRSAVKQTRDLPGSEAAEVCRATAELFEKKGNDLDAIALYERARISDPKGAKGVCRRLAVLYDRTGHYHKALAEHKKALALFPKDPNLLNDLGYCHYVRAHWDKAEKEFRKALAIDASHQRAWNNLGMTLGQQNRPVEAIEAFKRVIPESQAYSNLAFVLSTQGRHDQAKKAYERALSLDPDLQLARYALARLEKAPSPMPLKAIPETRLASQPRVLTEVTVIEEVPSEADGVTSGIRQASHNLNPSLSGITKTGEPKAPGTKIKTWKAVKYSEKIQ